MLKNNRIVHNNRVFTVQKNLKITVFLELTKVFSYLLSLEIARKVMLLTYYAFKLRKKMVLNHIMSFNICEVNSDLFEFIG